MQAPVGTAEGASTLAKLKCCGSEHPPTQRHNNRTRASRHFPDRGKPTPSYASCLALSSREGRNKVTHPTSVRRLVLISLVRQPLLRWSSITVFIVFSFVDTFFSVLSNPHLRGTQGTNLQLLESCFKSYSKVILPMFTNIVTLLFWTCFLQSKSRSTFVVLGAKALVAFSLVVYFFQSTCPGTLFSSPSLSFLPEQESDRVLNLYCQSSRREVCQSIRLRSPCQSPLDVSYQSTRISSLYPQATRCSKYLAKSVRRCFENSWS